MTLAVATSPAIKSSSFLGSTPETQVSNSFSPAAGDIITVTSYATDSFNHDWDAGEPTITDSLATHLTWNLVASVFDNAATGNTVRIALWWALAATAPGSMTASVTEATTAGQSIFGMAVAAKLWTGANTTAPIPASNLVFGVAAAAATGVSQSITPTATGSALMMAAGNRVAGAQTNTAGTGCFLCDNATGAGNATVATQEWVGTSSGPTLTTSLAPATLAVSNATSSLWTFLAYEVVPAPAPAPPAAGLLLSVFP
jgi:hypothetical protein